MSPVVGPVSPVSGVTGPGTAASVLNAARTTNVQQPTGVDFAAAMAQGLQNVQALQHNADSLSVAAATGELTDVHDYMIAATQAQVATELTVAVRNKAVEAFQEIMRMQL
jgi:flagellar hook-basal body complex protein FliE